jgi:hypothetical protein
VSWSSLLPGSDSIGCGRRRKGIVASLVFRGGNREAVGGEGEGDDSEGDNNQTTKPADYSEPQRNLFEEVIHAGDEGQRKGSEEGGRRVLTSRAGCAQLVGGLRWSRGGGGHHECSLVFFHGKYQTPADGQRQTHPHSPTPRPRPPTSSSSNNATL